ncbi:cache domain-containing sensor histidine kinase [Hungatella effluvii]|uniref:cache domain-containing sensor histidine kinase n=1 Tax=Hungatella effluvii TaxID=1096246 RepID=UPI0022E50B1C|nr:histidine kinase [Hungatella effluvii]
MKKKSIFFQILFPILNLILLCTITVSAILYTAAKKMLYEDTVKGNGSLLVQIDGNFNNLMQQFNTVISVSDSSTYFRTLLTEPCASQLDRFSKEMEIHRFLYNYYTLFTRYNAFTTVIGKNGVNYTTYTGDHLLVSPDELLKESWAEPLALKPYEQIVHTLSHPGITTATQGKNVVLFARSLVDGYTMEWCGWMFLEIDPVGFEQIYNNSYQDGDYVFITDQYGMVISSNCHGLINQTLPHILDIPTWHQGDRSTKGYLQDFDGRQYLALKTELSALDGYLIKYTNTGSINEELHHTLVWIIGAAALFALLACLFSFLIFRHLTRPIKQLSREMMSTRYGFEGKGSMGDSENEIDMLEQAFTNLLADVDAYTENLCQESIARREAELNSLRMQINPHFLYNTLSSIRYLVENDYDRGEVSNAISGFIKLLRSTISNKAECIPLNEELSNLDSYVTLMNFRYGERIHLKIFMPDPALNNCLIPKLLLQPVVENSIFHGFPHEEEWINITLYICEANGTLRMEISDNGCGIEEETLEKLRQGTSSSREHMTGVGLDNVNQRLHMMYGAEYGITINSTLGLGTIVKIQLPAVYKEGDEKQ